MIKQTMIQAATAIKRGEIKAAELTRAIFDEIKKNDLNAYLQLDEEGAFLTASAVDRLPLNARTGALCGVAIAVKDNIDVEGLRTTCASKILKDYRAKSDALVVQRLKKAGAVIVGKTNMDEFAIGSASTTSAFGRPLNPLDLDCVTGGSSGGSAAAVAGFQAFGALGSDTGGSIRQPAAYCGIFGLKPTLGSISLSGIFPLSPSFDQAGPLARTAQDCEILFDILRGHDPADASTSLIRGNDAERKNVIGIIKDIEKNIGGAALKAFEKGFADLRAAGFEFKEVRVPSFSEAGYIYSVLSYAETAQSLKRFEGSFALLGDEVRRRVSLGSKYLSDNTEMENAANMRQTLLLQLEGALSDCDCLLTPTAPTAAIRFDADPALLSDSDFFTQPASLCGLPALSVAVHIDGSLPLGLQLIGKKWEEKTLFSLSHFIECN